jgi:hypothetical protein
LRLPCSMLDDERTCVHVFSFLNMVTNKQCCSLTTYSELTVHFVCVTGYGSSFPFDKSIKRTQLIACCIVRIDQGHGALWDLDGIARSAEIEQINSGCRKLGCQFYYSCSNYSKHLLLTLKMLMPTCHAPRIWWCGTYISLRAGLCAPVYQTDVGPALCHWSHCQGGPRWSRCSWATKYHWYLLVIPAPDSRLTH